MELDSNNMQPNKVELMANRNDMITLASPRKKWYRENLDQGWSF